MSDLFLFVPVGLFILVFALKMAGVRTQEWFRPNGEKPSLKPESATVALLRRQLSDAGTAAEVEGDILAVCAARGWEIESTWRRHLRFASMYHTYAPDQVDREQERFKDWWTVNGYDAPSLAEAWDKACAYHDTAEKLKAKHHPEPESKS